MVANGDVQIIVEDENGEVVKTYELPSDKTDAPLAQPLKYLGLKGAKPADRPADPAPSQAGEASGSGAANKADKEAEDDKRIRFTIGGEGKRLTKEDFCREVWKLDAKTRREVVEKSDAPVDVKRLATMEREPVGPEIRMTGPSEERERGDGKEEMKAGEVKEETKGEERKGPERKVVGAGSTAADDEETPAERRRREAALGIGETVGEEESESESESEGERERFRRSIRFAQ